MYKNTVHKSDMKSAAEAFARWRAPLFLLVLCLFVFEALSGFILFFYGRLLPGAANLAAVHWVLGLVLLIPYAVYQWRHYTEVRAYAAQFHYRLGLYTFSSACVVLVSGFPLLLNLPHNGWVFRVVDLLHTVSSFAFLIFLCSHLVLVARLTLARMGASRTPNPGAPVRLLRLPVVLPLAFSILALLLAVLLSR